MKIDRTSFLYLEPDEKTIGDPNKFAQCSTCALFCGEERKRCFILGGNFEVLGTDTCALYANGDPQVDILSGNEVETMTPEQAGFERRQVRCQNCVYFNPTIGGCKLFAILDAEFPDDFDLGWKVKSTGCCNANLPIEDENKQDDAMLRFLNKKVTLQDLLSKKRIKEFKKYGENEILD